MFDYWLAHENAVFFNHIYMFMVGGFTIGSIIYMRTTAHKQQYLPLTPTLPPPPQPPRNVWDLHTCAHILHERCD
jgi:hypothetical protein